MAFPPPPHSRVGAFAPDLWVEHLLCGKLSRANTKVAHPLSLKGGPLFPWESSQHGLALSSQGGVVASTSPQAFLGVTSHLE